MDIEAVTNNLKLNVAEFLFGRRWSFPPELRRANKLSEAISCIQERWPDACYSASDPERPVFIFSAGWRSGSTLVQRLIFSSREVAIWGEPLGDAAVVARLAHSLGYITGQWPSESFFAREINQIELSNKWVANLAPEIRYLRSAHRAFFLNWCKQPVQERFGLERWGLKEVRLTIDHARYFKWLFPNARFLFVYRHPAHAFRSWRGNKWRSPWPGYNPKSAVAFARHWRLLMEGFLAGADEVDGMLIKFEDLVAGKVDLKELARFLEVKGFDETVLQRKINDPQVIVKKGQISGIDRKLLSWLCGDLMRKLDYL